MKSYIATLSTDIPYPGEDSEEREQQFLVFFEKNKRDTGAQWLRRTLLHQAFFSERLTWLARKMHTVMTERDMQRKAAN